jgi:CheY-like chemotaxis protein/DNA-binding MarR family transcriptional regulator
MKTEGTRENIGVLVVEDDSDLRAELVDGLRAAGFRCLGAPDGSAALEALRLCDHSVDVVLADVYMPRLGGIGLVGAIARCDAVDPWVRTVLMSGRGSDEIVREGLRTNAIEILPKPIAMPALVASIARAGEIAVAARRRFTATNTAPGGAPAVTMPASVEAQVTGSLGGDFPQLLAERIRRFMAFERERAEAFGRDLVAAPVWDMLLELLDARLRGNGVSVSSLCIAANAPATTALRRIDDLVAAGLVRRRPDPHDKRRVFVELTDDAVCRLDRFLSSRTIETTESDPPVRRRA